MNISEFEIGLLNIIEKIHNPILTKIMVFISALGDKGFLWIALGICLLLFKKTRRAGVCVLLALLIDSVLVNLWLKPLIGRIRPFEFDKSLIPLIARPVDASFPSGHTAASFAASTALFINFRKYGLASMVVAFVMGFSRIYLLVHFPSDVIAGMIIGIVLGYASCKPSFVQKI